MLIGALASGPPVTMSSDNGPSAAPMSKTYSSNTLSDIVNDGDSDWSGFADKADFHADNISSDWSFKDVNQTADSKSMQSADVLIVESALSTVVSTSGTSDPPSVTQEPLFSTVDPPPTKTMPQSDVINPQFTIDWSMGVTGSAVSNTANHLDYTLNPADHQAGTSSMADGDWSVFNTVTNSISTSKPSVISSQKDDGGDDNDSWVGFNDTIKESPPPFSPPPFSPPPFDDTSDMRGFSPPAATASFSCTDGGDDDEWSAFGEPPPLPTSDVSDLPMTSTSEQLDVTIMSQDLANELTSNDSHKPPLFDSSINAPDQSEGFKDWSAFSGPPPLPEVSADALFADIPVSEVQKTNKTDPITDIFTTNDHTVTTEPANKDAEEKSRSGSPLSPAFSPPPLSDRDFSPMKSADVSAASDWFNFPSDQQTRLYTDPSFYLLQTYLIVIMYQFSHVFTTL